MQNLLTLSFLISVKFYNLKNIISEETCFKNPNNPSCIDLIITKHAEEFSKFYGY